MSKRAIFARGSCRALRWMVLAALVAAIGAGEAAAQTVPEPDLLPPENFNATPGDQSVMLSWDAPGVASATVASYEYRHAAGIESYPDTWSGTGLRTATVGKGGTGTDLDNGTSYRFQVRSVGVDPDGIGQGAEAERSRSATENATPLAPPEAPRDFKVTPGDKEMKLEWKAPAATSPPFDSYEYYSGVGVADEGSKWTPATPLKGLTATVEDLTNGTTYTFQVRSKSTAGTTAADSVEGIPAGKPSEPTNLTASRTVDEAAGATGLTVILDWEVPSSTGGTDVPLTGYNYRIAGNAWTRLGAAMRSQVISGLNPNLPYTFQVQAVNAASDGSVASVSTGPSTTAGAPSAPGNLTALEGDGQVTLTWTAPTTGAPILRYEYKMDDGVWMSNALVLSATVTGLTNGTSYVFRVQAVNAAGVGAPTAGVTATPTTTPTPPTPPTTTGDEGQWSLTAPAHRAILAEGESLVPVSVRYTVPALPGPPTDLGRGHSVGDAPHQHLKWKTPSAAPPSRSWSPSNPP